MPEPLDRSMIDATSQREMSMRVIAQAAAARALGDKIDEAVARTRVEGDGLNATSHDGGIPNAPDVLHRPHRATTKERFIEERDEWGSLTASGDVTRTEVGNDRDASALGDHGRLANLQR